MKSQRCGKCSAKSTRNTAAMYDGGSRGCGRGRGRRSEGPLNKQLRVTSLFFFLTMNEKNLMTTELIERPLHTHDYVELENQYGAHNYHPLDVVIERAEGVWVYDVEGKRY